MDGMDSEGKRGASYSMHLVTTMLDTSVLVSVPVSVLVLDMARRQLAGGCFADVVKEAVREKRMMEFRKARRGRTGTRTCRRRGQQGEGRSWLKR